MPISHTLAPAFDQIINLIEIRVRYLISHKIYLFKMARNEINQEDIVGYAQDIFNVKVTPKEFQISYLPVLEKTLSERINFFKEIRRIASLKNTQAIAILNLILDYEMRYSISSRDRIKSKDVEIQEKLSATFHELDSLKLLHTQLQPILPPNYEQLAQTIKFKDRTSKKKRIRNGEEFHQSSVNISFLEPISQGVNVNEVLIDLLKEVTEIKSPFKKDFSHELTQVTLAEKSISATIAEYKSKFQEHKETIQKIENHVNTFFAVDQHYQKIIDIINNFKTQVNYALSLTNAYKNFVIEGRKKLNEINSSFAATHQLFKDLKSGKKTFITTSFVESDFDSVIEIIAIIKKRLNDEFPQEISTLEELEIFTIECNRSMDEVLGQIKGMNASLTTCFEQVKQMEAEQLRQAQEQQVKNEKRQLELLEQRKREQDNFAQTQKEKLEQFRHEVNQKREDKKLAQMRDQAKSEVDTPEKQTPTYKNVAMEAMLNALKPKHVALLREILEGKRGIKYKKIHSLITKHLGGTISEVGNGSSHKRIQLENYITDMITHTHATGGMARPHGKAHNPEELSYFNIDLVKIVLINAKITLDVVAELEKNLEKHKMNASINSHSFFSLEKDEGTSQSEYNYTT
ncbi:hypothetical protein [Legionella brunensis]|uniref:Uncharacterized protein n=1 Tax=Legionella brunensis TaxID=29422 RepID=A0A0W0S1A7_9GAMM|nr:hypothetical protein [Legionella brunensis]KTC77066.1 hypothetical protein Lbru_3173 [Legionella brunensis]